MFGREDELMEEIQRLEKEKKELVILLGKDVVADQKQKKERWRLIDENEKLRQEKHALEKELSRVLEGR